VNALHSHCKVPVSEQELHLSVGGNYGVPILHTFLLQYRRVSDIH
jgi:hypothetical protein